MFNAIEIIPTKYINEQNTTFDDMVSIMMNKTSFCSRKRKTNSSNKRSKRFKRGKSKK